MKKMTTETIAKEKLEKIYKENDSDEAARKLGISTSSLYNYLRDWGIPKKGRGGRKKLKVIP